MKEPIFPPRLTDSSTDDFVREVLRSGRREAPEVAQAQVALAKYMDLRKQGGLDADLRPATSWRKLSGKLFGPVALLAAICFTPLIHSSTDAVSQAPTSPTPLTTTPPAEGSTPLPAPHAPVALVAPAAPSIPVEDLPSAREEAASPREPAGRRGHEPAQGRVTAAGSLHDELTVVEAARAALSSNNPDECLRHLAGYDRRFHQGLLAHEVDAMQIEALAARGERERARRLGRSFLAANPSSPYASHIQSILSLMPDERGEHAEKGVDSR